jgi:hypothetical protein
MYINYLNKENFENVEDGCNIEFNPAPIGSCEQYSNEEYKKMREDYWKAVVASEKLEESNCDEDDLVAKIQGNNDLSQTQLNKYNTDIDAELEDVTAEQKKIIDNKQKMDELESNIVYSKQRLSDSNKNNYRNKIKLIIFIVVILVFVLIELILIIV